MPVIVSLSHQIRDRHLLVTTSYRVMVFIMSIACGGKKTRKLDISTGKKLMARLYNKDVGNLRKSENARTDKS